MFELILVACLKADITKCAKIPLTVDVVTLSEQISCGGNLLAQRSIAVWQDMHPDHIVTAHTCRRKQAGEQDV